MTCKPLPFLLFISLLTLAACDSVLLERDNIATITLPAPVSQVTSREPADVLQDFINAWSGEDYETMYRLLAGRSRELFARQVFINRYTEVHSEMSFAGVSHSLNQVNYQGTTAVIDYDIVVESNTFGRIRDNNRTMRLVNEGGWKVAWSTMDIFDALSSKARLKDDPRFPTRADILDRNGNSLAEEGGLVASLYVAQQDMNGVDECLDTLGLVTRQQVNTLRNIFAEYLAETLFQIAEIDPERYIQYQAALENDCGITTSDDGISKVLQYRTRRYYGHGIATHVVGYIGQMPSEQIQFWEAQGYDETNLVGRAGIEYTYEITLAGKPQRTLRIVAQDGEEVRELVTSAGTPPKPVTLTIDVTCKKSQRRRWRTRLIIPCSIGVASRWAAPSSPWISTPAKILAMTSYPSFDPHIFNPDTRYNVANRTAQLNRDQRLPFGNKAIAEQYTPGSVYKIVTLLAAASENDIFGHDEQFDCGIEWYGQESYGDARPVRYDWRLLENKRATGLVDMSRALATSCNPFFWEMGARLWEKEANLQANYAEMLGFGSATGIAGLGIEASGNVAFPDNPDESTEAINNAIGQGNVSVTALQMAKATAMIANGGIMYKPYVVSHVGNPGSSDYKVENKPTRLRQVDFDPDALAIVRKGMCDVTTVEDVGTAWLVFGDADYQLCGKTGTAETAGQPNAWFVAYYPAEEPRIAFAGVMANSREGSEVVAPMIRRILDIQEGGFIKPYPGWWQTPYNPLPSQEEALAVYDPE